MVNIYVTDDYENPENKIYVITQLSPDGKKFDEHKAMLGCKDLEEAKKLFLEHAHTDKVFGGIKEYTIEEFRKFIKHEEENDLELPDKD